MFHESKLRDVANIAVLQDETIDADGCARDDW